MEARTLIERLGFIPGSRPGGEVRRPAADPQEFPPPIYDETALKDAAEHEAKLEAADLEAELRGRHSEEIALDTPFIKGSEVIPEGVDVIIERNRDDATTAVPELAALYAAGFLEDASIKHIEGDPDKIGRKLLERALLALIEHRLEGQELAETFHPEKHTQYQLGEARLPHARLSIAEARPVSKIVGGAEHTYKRAWVYDPSKREGYRFRQTLISAEISLPNASVRSDESSITIDAKEKPPKRVDLVRAMRTLAESHRLTPKATEPDE